HGAALSVQPDCAVQDVPVAGEVGLPEAMPEHDSAARIQIAGLECAAHLRRNTKELEESEADRHREHFTSAADARQDRSAGCPSRGGGLLKAAACGAPILKFGVGVEYGNCCLIPNRLLPDHNQPAWILVGQRPEEHCVQDAEDCGGGSDAERQSRDDNGREAWSVREDSQPIEDILPKLRESRPAPGPAHILFD